jgi:hypothetical protein
LAAAAYFLKASRIAEKVVFGRASQGAHGLAHAVVGAQVGVPGGGSPIFVRKELHLWDSLIGHLVKPLLEQGDPGAMEHAADIAKVQEWLAANTLGAAPRLIHFERFTV